MQQRAIWNQYLSPSKANRIRYIKTSKPMPAKEKVEVIRDFELNGVKYKTGNIVELGSFDLIRAKKRRNVRSIGKDPFIKCAKVIVIKRFSMKGQIMLPGQITDDLTGSALQSCLISGKVKLYDVEQEEKDK